MNAIRQHARGGSDSLSYEDAPTPSLKAGEVLVRVPELARVGLNEREAKDRRILYRLAKTPMEVVLRARTLSETRGFLKALVEAGSDRILGFTAFGPEAGELLPVIQLAMKTQLPYAAISELILTHPTMAEGLRNLFRSKSLNQ